MAIGRQISRANDLFKHRVSDHRPRAELVNCYYKVFTVRDLPKIQINYFSAKHVLKLIEQGSPQMLFGSQAAALSSLITWNYTAYAPYSRGQLESGNEHTERPAPRIDRPIAGGFQCLVSYVELFTKPLPI